MGGGGGGSQNVPPPPLGTQYAFQNQPGADIGAYSGAQSISGNSFYPNPGMSSFLFPQGVTNSAGIQTIAPQGQPPPPQAAPPPAPAPQNTSFLTPQDAQTILQGGYSTLAPSVQAQVQSMAGYGGGPSIFGQGGQGSAGPTMDQSLAFNLMRDGGNVSNLDPNSMAQLDAIAYGGGGGGGGPGITGMPGMAQGGGGPGGGYSGGAQAYAPWGPQGVGGVNPAGGGGGGGINQGALQQGGIGGGGTMDFSYPGAAAYLALGPDIAAAGLENQKVNTDALANLYTSQMGVGAAGNTLANQAVSNPNTDALNATGNQFLGLGSSNPLSSSLAQGGNAFMNSAMSNPASSNLYGTGAGFLSQSQNPALQGYENQTLNTGFDPQQALYDRTLQQTTDQTRAGLEARGLDMTPYGAGVESDALRNFNIDWQNTQLGRQGQAATNANTLAGMQSGLANTGLGLTQGGANIQNQFGQTGGALLNQAGALQNQFAQTGGQLIGQGATNQAELAKAGSELLGQNVMGQSMISDLSQAGLSGLEGTLSSLQGGAQSAYAQPQQGIQDYLSYLTAATGQNSVNANIYGSQLQAANQAQANSNAQSLGLLSGIGGLVGK